MPPPHISLLVIIIAALGGSILKHRVFQTAYQAGPIKHDMDKYQHDHGDLDEDTKLGLEYLDNVTRALGVIRTIHMTMGLLQTSMEELIGERLITDNFYRIERLHDIETDEGQVFNQVFIVSIQEIEDELAHGLTTEVWDLTGIAIDNLLTYGKKLLNYRKYMNKGLEKAKINGKFENVDFEVTKKLVIIAGAEKCAYSEWKTIDKTMGKFVELVRNGLKLKKDSVSEKMETLNEVWEHAYTANIFADSYVSNIGVTSLSSNHSTWLEQERDNKMVPFQVGGVSDRGKSNKLQEIDNLFLAIGFTVWFDMKPMSYRVEYSRRFPLPSWPYGAPKMIS